MKKVKSIFVGLFVIGVFIVNIAVIGSDIGNNEKLILNSFRQAFATENEDDEAVWIISEYDTNVVILIN